MTEILFKHRHHQLMVLALGQPRDRDGTAPMQPVPASRIGKLPPWLA
jgi:hypothetical protein